MRLPLTWGKMIFDMLQTPACLMCAQCVCNHHYNLYEVRNCSTENLLFKTPQTKRKWKKKKVNSWKSCIIQLRYSIFSDWKLNSPSKRQMDISHHCCVPYGTRFQLTSVIQHIGILTSALESLLVTHHKITLECTVSQTDSYGQSNWAVRFCNVYWDWTFLHAI